MCLGLLSLQERTHSISKVSACGPGTFGGSRGGDVGPESASALCSLLWNTLERDWDIVQCLGYGSQGFT